jgi:hypothetical protein
MKCEPHSSEAAAVCAYCGRALCSQCQRATSTPRIACSATCAEALAKADRAIQLTLGKSVQQAQATAFGSYVIGILSIVFALYGHHVYPQMARCNSLLGAFGVILIIWGFWFHSVSRKK